MDRFTNKYPAEMINCAGCDEKFHDQELNSSGYCPDCAAEIASRKREDAVDAAKDKENENE